LLVRRISLREQRSTSLAGGREGRNRTMGVLQGGWTREKAARKSKGPRGGGATGVEHKTLIRLGRGKGSRRSANDQQGKKCTTRLKAKRRGILQKERPPE